MKNTRSLRGFSLVELLLVVAIIAVLIAVSLPTYGRALGQAKDTAGKEAMRQKAIAKKADGANAVGQLVAVDYDRPRARQAFYQSLDTGRNERYITEMVYAVRNDDEFRAYWHTMISGASQDPLEFAEDGSLIAYDQDGNRFVLPPTSQKNVARHPAYWDLITVKAAYMTALPSQIIVTYNDGTISTIRYPGPFPATPTVARLTQRYIEE